MAPGDGVNTPLKFWRVQVPKGNYGYITVLAPTDVEAIQTAHAAGHLRHTVAVGTYAPTVGGHRGTAGLGVPVDLQQNLFLCSQAKPGRVILAQTKATQRHRRYQEEIVEILA